MSSSASEVVSTMTGIVRARVALDLGEHLSAALARQVEVEQHQIGAFAARRTRPRRARNCIASTPSLTTDNTLPTFVRERLADEQDISGVVLDEQDRD